MSYSCCVFASTVICVSKSMNEMSANSFHVSSHIRGSNRRSSNEYNDAKSTVKEVLKLDSATSGMATLAEGPRRHRSNTFGRLSKLTRKKTVEGFTKRSTKLSFQTPLRNCLNSRLPKSDLHPEFFIFEPHSDCRRKVFYWDDKTAKSDRSSEQASTFRFSTNCDISKYISIITSRRRAASPSSFPCTKDDLALGHHSNITNNSNKKAELACNRSRSVDLTASRLRGQSKVHSWHKPHTKNVTVKEPADQQKLEFRREHRETRCKPWKTLMPNTAHYGAPEGTDTYGNFVTFGKAADGTWLKSKICKPKMNKTRPIRPESITEFDDKESPGPRFYPVGNLEEFSVLSTISGGRVPKSKDEIPSLNGVSMENTFQRGEHFPPISIYSDCNKQISFETLPPASGVSIGNTPDMYEKCLHTSRTPGGNMPEDRKYDSRNSTKPSTVFTYAELNAPNLSISNSNSANLLDPLSNQAALKNKPERLTGNLKQKKLRPSRIPVPISPRSRERGTEKEDTLKSLSGSWKSPFDCLPVPVQAVTKISTRSCVTENVVPMEKQLPERIYSSRAQSLPRKSPCTKINTASKSSASKGKLEITQKVKALVDSYSKFLQKEGVMGEISRISQGTNDEAQLINNEEKPFMVVQKNGDFLTLRQKYPTDVHTERERTGRLAKSSGWQKYIGVSTSPPRSRIGQTRKKNTACKLYSKSFVQPTLSALNRLLDPLKPDAERTSATAEIPQTLNTTATSSTKKSFGQSIQNKSGPKKIKRHAIAMDGQGNLAMPTVATIFSESSQKGASYLGQSSVDIQVTKKEEKIPEDCRGTQHTTNDKAILSFQSEKLDKRVTQTPDEKMASGIQCKENETVTDTREQHAKNAPVHQKVEVRTFKTGSQPYHQSNSLKLKTAKSRKNDRLRQHCHVMNTGKHFPSRSSPTLPLIFLHQPRTAKEQDSNLLSSQTRLKHITNKEPATRLSSKQSPCTLHEKNPVPTQLSVPQEKLPSQKRAGVSTGRQRQGRSKAVFTYQGKENSLVPCYATGLKAERLRKCGVSQISKFKTSSATSSLKLIKELPGAYSSPPATAKRETSHAASKDNFQDLPDAQGVKLKETEIPGDTSTSSWHSEILPSINDTNKKHKASPSEKKGEIFHSAGRPWGEKHSGSTSSSERRLNSAALTPGLVDSSKSTMKGISELTLTSSESMSKDSHIVVLRQNNLEDVTAISDSAGIYKRGEGLLRLNEVNRMQFARKSFSDFRINRKSIHYSQSELLQRKDCFFRLHYRVLSMPPPSSYDPLRCQLSTSSYGNGKVTHSDVTKVGTQDRTASTSRNSSKRKNQLIDYYGKTFFPGTAHVNSKAGRDKSSLSCSTDVRYNADDRLMQNEYLLPQLTFSESWDSQAKTVNSQITLFEKDTETLPEQNRSPTSLSGFQTLLQFWEDRSASHKIWANVSASSTTDNANDAVDDTAPQEKNFHEQGSQEKCERMASKDTNGSASPCRVSSNKKGSCSYRHTKHVDATSSPLVFCANSKRSLDANRESDNPGALKGRIDYSKLRHDVQVQKMIPVDSNLLHEKTHPMKRSDESMVLMSCHALPSWNDPSKLDETILSCVGKNQQPAEKIRNWLKHSAKSTWHMKFKNKPEGKIINSKSAKSQITSSCNSRVLRMSGDKSVVQQAKHGRRNAMQEKGATPSSHKSSFESNSQSSLNIHPSSMWTTRRMPYLFGDPSLWPKATPYMRGQFHIIDPTIASPAASVSKRRVLNLASKKNHRHDSDLRVDCVTDKDLRCSFPQLHQGKLDYRVPVKPVLLCKFEPTSNVTPEESIHRNEQKCLKLQTSVKQWRHPGLTLGESPSEKLRLPPLSSNQRPGTPHYVVRSRHCFESSFDSDKSESLRDVHAVEMKTKPKLSKEPTLMRGHIVLSTTPHRTAKSEFSTKLCSNEPTSLYQSTSNSPQIPNNVKAKEADSKGGEHSSEESHEIVCHCAVCNNTMQRIKSNKNARALERKDHATRKVSEISSHKLSLIEFISTRESEENQKSGDKHGTQAMRCGEKIDINIGTNTSKGRTSAIGHHQTASANICPCHQSQGNTLLCHQNLQTDQIANQVTPVKSSGEEAENCRILVDEAGGKRNRLLYHFGTQQPETKAPEKLHKEHENRAKENVQSTITFPKLSLVNDNEIPKERTLKKIVNEVEIVIGNDVPVQDFVDCFISGLKGERKSNGQTIHEPHRNDGKTQEDKGKVKSLKSAKSAHGKKIRAPLDRCASNKKSNGTDTKELFPTSASDLDSCNESKTMTEQRIKPKHGKPFSRRRFLQALYVRKRSAENKRKHQKPYRQRSRLHCDDAFDTTEPDSAPWMPKAKEDAYIRRGHIRAQHLSRHPIQDGDFGACAVGLGRNHQVTRGIPYRRGNTMRCRPLINSPVNPRPYRENLTNRYISSKSLESRKTLLWKSDLSKYHQSDAWKRSDFNFSSLRNKEGVDNGTLNAAVNEDAQTIQVFAPCCFPTAGKSVKVLVSKDDGLASKRVQLSITDNKTNEECRVTVQPRDKHGGLSPKVETRFGHVYVDYYPQGAGNKPSVNSKSEHDICGHIIGDNVQTKEKQAFGNQSDFKNVNDTWVFSGLAEDTRKNNTTLPLAESNESQKDVTFNSCLIESAICHQPNTRIHADGRFIEPMNTVRRCIPAGHVAWNPTPERSFVNSKTQTDFVRQKKMGRLRYRENSCRKSRNSNAFTSSPAGASSDSSPCDRMKSLRHTVRDVPSSPEKTSSSRRRYTKSHICRRKGWSQASPCSSDSTSSWRSPAIDRQRSSKPLKSYKVSPPRAKKQVKQYICTFQPSDKSPSTTSLNCTRTTSCRLGRSKAGSSSWRVTANKSPSLKFMKSKDTSSIVAAEHSKKASSNSKVIRISGLRNASTSPIVARSLPTSPERMPMDSQPKSCLDKENQRKASKTTINKEDVANLRSPCSQRSYTPESYCKLKGPRNRTTARNIKDEFLEIPPDREETCKQKLPYAGNQVRAHGQDYCTEKVKNDNKWNTSRPLQFLNRDRNYECDVLSPCRDSRPAHRPQGRCNAMVPEEDDLQSPDSQRRKWKCSHQSDDRLPCNTFDSPQCIESSRRARPCRADSAYCDEDHCQAIQHLRVGNSRRQDGGLRRQPFDERSHAFESDYKRDEEPYQPEPNQPVGFAEGGYHSRSRKLWYDNKPCQRGMKQHNYCDENYQPKQYQERSERCAYQPEARQRDYCTETHKALDYFPERKAVKVKGYQRNLAGMVSRHLQQQQQPQHQQQYDKCVYQSERRQQRFQNMQNQSNTPIQLFDGRTGYQEPYQHDCHDQFSSPRLQSPTCEERWYENEGYERHQRDMDQKQHRDKPCPQPLYPYCSNRYQAMPSGRNTPCLEDTYKGQREHGYQRQAPDTCSASPCQQSGSIQYSDKPCQMGPCQEQGQGPTGPCQQSNRIHYSDKPLQMGPCQELEQGATGPCQQSDRIHYSEKPYLTGPCQKLEQCPETTQNRIDTTGMFKRGFLRCCQKAPLRSRCDINAPSNECLPSATDLPKAQSSPCRTTPARNCAAAFAKAGEAGQLQSATPSGASSPPCSPSRMRNSKRVVPRHSYRTKPPSLSPSSREASWNIRIHGASPNTSRRYRSPSVTRQESTGSVHTISGYLPQARGRSASRKYPMSPEGQSSTCCDATPSPGHHEDSGYDTPRFGKFRDGDHHAGLVRGNSRRRVTFIDNGATAGDDSRGAETASNIRGRRSDAENCENGRSIQRGAETPATGDSHEEEDVDGNGGQHIDQGRWDGGVDPSWFATPQQQSGENCRPVGPEKETPSAQKLSDWDRAVMENVRKRRDDFNRFRK